MVSNFKRVPVLVETRSDIKKSFLLVAVTYTDKPAELSCIYRCEILAVGRFLQNCPNCKTPLFLIEWLWIPMASTPWTLQINKYLCFFPLGSRKCSYFEQKLIFLKKCTTSSFLSIQLQKMTYICWQLWCKGGHFFLGCNKFSS